MSEMLPLRQEAAAMYASSQLVKGSARAALTGGVEEVNEMIFSVLDRIGALARGEHQEARPFDRCRNGMVIGEGAAALVLQAQAAAKYGYLSGFGMARDTTATISDWGEDHRAAAAAMRAAIEDADLALADIDAIYASANSTR